VSRLNEDNPESGIDDGGAVYKVNEEIVGGGYQKVRPDRAVQDALHLDREGDCKIEDGGQAAWNESCTDLSVAGWET